MKRNSLPKTQICSLAMALLAPAMFAACSGDNTPPADAGVSTDAGEAMADAGTEADAGSQMAVDLGTPDAGEEVCGDPGEPYGTSEGSRFFPFTLNDCEGNPFSFYGETEGYCESSFTVVTMAAGWCGPCRVEAELLQEQIVEAYAAQGVRVIVAVIQDNNYNAPDASFCSGWKTQYGLTNPVLLDPVQETQIYFPRGALPASLIVDSQGVIVHREYGVSQELRTLRDRLDQLLAE